MRKRSCCLAPSGSSLKRGQMRLFPIIVFAWGKYEIKDSIPDARKRCQEKFEKGTNAGAFSYPSYCEAIAFYGMMGYHF